MQWQFPIKKPKADVFVPDNPLLETRRGGEIMESFVGNIVAGMPEFVAEKEHEKNSKREIV